MLVPVRGAAPSIVCPRCGREAPPADSVAAFVTCQGCGLAIRADAQERQVPVRRARPESKAEGDAGPARPVRPSRKLSPRQILFILAAVFGAGIVLECLPSAREQREQAAREQVEARVRQDREAAELEAAKWSALGVLASGGPACERVVTVIGLPCRTADETNQTLLREAIRRALLELGQGSGAPARCGDVVVELERARRTFDCE